MSVEIERKFIVDNPFSFPRDTNSIYYCETNITQGYMAEGVDLRVRVTSQGMYEENEQAFLTIKGSRVNMSRPEFEYEIPVKDAYDIMSSLHARIVNKTRHKLKAEDMIWEVDVFKDHNKGLVIAEVELDSDTKLIKLPQFVGEEVTGLGRYYNSSLAYHPYSEWKNE
jgi:adenylate cyclase